MTLKGQCLIRAFFFKDKNYDLKKIRMQTFFE